jgi:hypothetical protein
MGPASGSSRYAAVHVAGVGKGRMAEVVQAWATMEAASTGVEVLADGLGRAVERCQHLAMLESGS